MVSFRQFLMRLDSKSMPHRPPPRSMMEIDTCSMSVALHSLRLPARCSRKTLVILGDSICENHTRLGELTAPDVGLPLVRGPLAALIQRLDGLTSLSFSKHTNCGGIFSIKEHLIIIKANPMSSVEGPRMWLLPR